MPADTVGGMLDRRATHQVSECVSMLDQSSIVQTMTMRGASDEGGMQLSNGSDFTLLPVPDSSCGRRSANNTINASRTDTRNERVAPLLLVAFSVTLAGRLHIPRHSTVYHAVPRDSNTAALCVYTPVSAFHIAFSHAHCFKPCCRLRSLALRLPSPRRFRRRSDIDGTAGQRMIEGPD